MRLNYSALDRFLHRVAFGAPGLQMAAAELESKLCESELRSVVSGPPIFITSLPRAGTTLLLEALCRFPTLASHTYRDMPFVMAPLLWARLSAAFRKRADLRERAHGDGMRIGFDSPEAFEEVLWRAFWQAKYSKDGIELWTAQDSKVDADTYFAEHFRKVIVLRQREGRGEGPITGGRYLSKNNGNIARLDLLRGMFPTAITVVPFREPLQHAFSLLRQHENFLRQHREEPFVERYMADIGHYEFGSLHRPIAFPNLAPLISGRNPLGIDYWLAYWIAAFEHILRHRNNIVLVPYESACAAPRETLAALSEALDLAAGPTIDEAAALFRSRSAPCRVVHEVDADLKSRAAALHAELLDAAMPIPAQQPTALTAGRQFA